MGLVDHPESWIFDLIDGSTRKTTPTPSLNFLIFRKIPQNSAFLRVFEHNCCFVLFIFVPVTILLEKYSTAK